MSLVSLRSKHGSERPRSLGDSVQDPFSGQGEHEAGEAAEDHADADEGADDPDGAGGPGAPDHDGKNESDDSVN